jgi:hypothetical protein
MTDTLLENFESAPKRQKYYEENLPYMSPVEVQLGIEKKLVKGVLTDFPIKGYMVPFLDSIKVMLEMPEVWHCVITARMNFRTIFVMECMFEVSHYLLITLEPCKFFCVMMMSSLSIHWAAM